MKTVKEIEDKIDSYEETIKGLEKQINECLKHQKENGERPNPYCDYIVGREERIRQFKTAVEMLEWVLR